MGQVFVKASRRARSHVRRIASGPVTKIIGTRFVKGSGYIISMREGWKGKYAGKVGIAGAIYHKTRAGARKDARALVKHYKSIGYYKA